LFFNYIIKNQSIDKCDISPVNWVYPILTGHIYVLAAAIEKKQKRHITQKESNKYERLGRNI
jgi:hypothetical protein